jgi:hypothetical protein
VLVVAIRAHLGREPENSVLVIVHAVLRLERQELEIDAVLVQRHACTVLRLLASELGRAVDDGLRVV